MGGCGKFCSPFHGLFFSHLFFLFLFSTSSFSSSSSSSSSSFLSSSFPAFLLLLFFLLILIQQKGEQITDIATLFSRDDEKVKNVHYILTPKPWELDETGAERLEDGPDRWWWEVEWERRRWEAESGLGRHVNGNGTGQSLNQGGNGVRVRYGRESLGRISRTIMGSL
jgi:hypothetical protein